MKNTYKPYSFEKNSYPPFSFQHMENCANGEKTSGHSRKEFAMFPVYKILDGGIAVLRLSCTTGTFSVESLDIH